MTYPGVFLLNVFLLVEHLPRSRSVTAVEEECDSADDEPGGLSVGSHLQSAEELLSVEIEVKGSFDDALRVRIWLTLRYPSQGTDWELEYLRSLASNFIDLGAIECATLEE